MALFDNLNEPLANRRRVFQSEEWMGASERVRCDEVDEGGARGSQDDCCERALIPRSENMEISTFSQREPINECVMFRPDDPEAIVEIIVRWDTWEEGA